ncbi:MAG: hypothetical protein ETSY1_17975 [Candidatus Entotheonella factor]|uniref:Uncharacterized protein n=1 Tax=Entotheonella factor TaxID=1429438 RepID=W4LL46_ENTF1|nr:hypothetical protein [Candidatus Entotheonella palauensis]ETW98639.1 MAG: hypothetical protein ETSY1_17975 [Candidatus Entotheonella factor]
MDKFRAIAHQYLPACRADTIERAAWAVDEFEDVGAFVELLVDR